MSSLQWYKSSGVIRYFDDGFKVWVEVDQGISDFHRSLIPKYLNVQPQKYSPHISVVRNETPVNLTRWKDLEGHVVDFQYSNIVYFGKVYCWLNVFSTSLEDLRTGLGLPISSEYTRPPEGFSKCFHMTLGNFKGK